MIHPGVNSVAIAAKLGNGKLSKPPVIDDRLHGSLVPAGGAFMPEQQDSSYGVVTVCEYIGFYPDQVANRAFGRETASVHFRRDALNDDATAALFLRPGKSIQVLLRPLQSLELPVLQQIDFLPSLMDQ